MAPLLALLSILFGGESEAAAAPVPRSPVAIVEVAHEHERVVEQPEAVDASDADDAQASTEERWIGAIELPQGTLEFVVTIVETEDGLTGKLDIPIQGLMGGELSGVHREGDELSFHFEIPNLPEVNWPRWVVTIDESGKAAEGVLNQSGASFPSSLVLDETGKAGVLKRPQHPTRPLPYPEIEVVIDAGDHTLAGTLTVPNEDDFGKGPFPGAVLITGSGPQDRDETLLGHKPFFVLSDHLTRSGIAVLRYDDRGVGKSEGDFGSATTMDFVDDAKACADWLGEREEVNRVGLIGHSEGGLVAPFVASASDGVDFVVLLAAPGMPGREVLVRQVHDISKAAGANEALLEKQAELMNKAYDLVLGDGSEDEVRSVLDELVRVQFGYGSEGHEDTVGPLVDQSYAQLTEPWWRQFLTLDPRPALREMTQPVYALNGSLDLQVPPDQNLAEIERVFEEAGKSDKLTAVELDGLNHLFQPTKTGLLSEYGEIETTFDEGVMQMIADWILKTVR